MNLISKVLLLVVATVVSFTMMIGYGSAFDLFSHCATQSDGTKVCGPCANNPNAPTCQQASSEGGSNNRITGSKSIINAAVSIIAVVTGLAAVLMIIISGFKYVTAGGSNSDAAKSARSTLMAAVIGLVVVALAWTITRFIIDKVVQ